MINIYFQRIPYRHYIYQYGTDRDRVTSSSCGRYSKMNYRFLNVKAFKSSYRNPFLNAPLCLAKAIHVRSISTSTIQHYRLYLPICMYGIRGP